MESEDAREKADGEDQNAQAGNDTSRETTETAKENSTVAIDNEAPARDAQNEDNETYGAVDNVNESLFDTAETRGENGVGKATPGDGTSRIGTGAESCVEGADTGDVYRRVRELALGAINAVRAASGVNLKW